MTYVIVITVIITIALITEALLERTMRPTCTAPCVYQHAAHVGLAYIQAELAAMQQADDRHAQHSAEAQALLARCQAIADRAHDELGGQLTQAECTAAYAAVDTLTMQAQRGDHVCPELRAGLHTMCLDTGLTRAAMRLA